MSNFDIDADVSDLFFNHDISHCKINDSKGDFVDFDKNKMFDEADLFLQSLNRLGVGGLPSKEELVYDFLNRI